MSAPVQIVPVGSARDLDDFIRLPAQLHANDPNFVPPLMLERRQALSAKGNPFLARAEAQFWLARRDGRDVGRISAQIDPLALSRRPGIGQFGMIAGEDDAEVFAALTDTAEEWLKARGMASAQGPFSLSINQESGLLVDGFDAPPMLMMGHDAPYMGPRLEQQGYAKAVDLKAYLYDKGNDVFERRIRALVDRPRPAGLTLRPVDRRHYTREIETVTEIFNDAWADNWGFVPLTSEETAHLARELKPLVHERLVWFAEMHGRPAGFGICLPNLNEAIADLDGRLLPLGWAKVLWRLKVAGLKTCRVPLMGVRQEFARGLGGRLIPFLIIDAMRREAIKLGYEAVELSWILETNTPMRRINEALGGRAYKTYRIYEKALA